MLNSWVFCYFVNTLNIYIYNMCCNKLYNIFNIMNINMNIYSVINKSISNQNGKKGEMKKQKKKKKKLLLFCFFFYTNLFIIKDC